MNYYVFAIDISHAKAISRKQNIPDFHVRYIDYPWRFCKVSCNGKTLHVSSLAIRSKRHDYEDVVLKAIQLGFKLNFIKEE